MANERYEEKYSGQDDGEYHFADDQVNYEMEPEAAKETVAAPAMASPKEDMLNRLKKNRRVLIGIVVGIVLLGIFYKILAPTSTAPMTDFDQQAAVRSPTKAGTAKMNQPVIAVPTMPQVAPAVTAPVVAQPQPTGPAAAVVNSSMTTAQPAAAPTPAATPTLVMTGVPTTSTPPLPVTAAQQPTAPPSQVLPTPLDSQSKPVADRLAYLEQQNSAMMNLLQTQYGQKIADYQTQNAEMKTQIQELNTRIAGMEVAFHQLTKILRGMNKQAMVRTGDAMSSSMSASATTRSVSTQRMIYTVQAIIPGRAWLKADSGDTVTVAEGDVLKDYGKVTKIDPYDGIVNIDTGSRVITLTYGAGGD